MYSRLAFLALALALCHADPQHHEASSYSSFTQGSHGGQGGAANGYSQHTGHAYGQAYGHAYVAPVVTKFAAVAPIAKVVAPVLAIGKQVAHQIDYFAPPHYQYEYAVEDKHTGDVKSQHEERDGDVTKGYYTVNEPDGTILTVHYTVDKHSGFQAVVERKGHAAHPQAVKKVAVVAPVVHHAPLVHHAPVVSHYGHY